MTTMVIDMEDLCIAREGDTPEDRYVVYNAQPAVYTMERINDWKFKDGHRIIIECLRDVDTDYDVTHEWLSHYEVPYDDVRWKV